MAFTQLRKHLVHSCGPFGDVSCLCRFGVCMPSSSDSPPKQACNDSIYNDPFTHKDVRRHFQYNKHAASAVDGIYGMFLHLCCLFAN